MAIIKTVIFDMDGTLVDSCLDFDAIRTELGLPKVPLLEAMERMPDDARRRAEQVVFRHEDRAARGSTLFPHAWETLDLLASRSIRVGLMTRNRRASVNTILDKHGLSFDLIRTREDGEIKPSPESILDMCRALGSPPEETLSVGDHLFDVQAAKAAGCVAVLIVHGSEPPGFADQADVVIRSLREVPALVGV